MRGAEMTKRPSPWTKIRIEAEKRGIPIEGKMPFEIKDPVKAAPLNPRHDFEPDYSPVMRVISKAPMTEAEITESLGWHPGRVKRVVVEMYQNRLIKADRGKFSPV
jgi:hypothetical protein